MTQLSLSNIKKSFGSVDVLHDINLEIESGEFVVFVGPSGCGKSTLLRLIAGLEEISDGTLKIGDTVANQIPPSNRGIAMVFQSYALYPHMSVFDNMAFGLKLSKFPKAVIKEKVERAADMLQLTPYLDRLPKALSGGQRQRVAIGRAVTRDPKVFLFDEPLSNLDAALRVATRIEIAALKQSMPESTMIYVTHDQVEAMTLADRIVVLSAGQIEQVGTPMDLYHKPHNKFVAGFIGSPEINFFDAKAPSGQNASKLSVLGGPEFDAKHGAFLRPSDEISQIGVRPEHMSISSQADARVVGQAIAVEKLGELTILHLTSANQQTFAAKVDADNDVKIGDTVHLTFADEAIQYFSSDGRSLQWS